VLIRQHRMVRSAAKQRRPCSWLAADALGATRDEHSALVASPPVARRRGTAVWYSSAAAFPRALVHLSAQIRAQRSLGDRKAPSSQRGGQGFESPQLHR